MAYLPSAVVNSLVVMVYLSFVMNLTVVRFLGCWPLGSGLLAGFCYIVPNQLILYHRVTLLSSFSGIDGRFVLLRFIACFLGSVMSGMLCVGLCSRLCNIKHNRINLLKINELRA